MAVDLETLLAPVSEASPAGEDLSYDPERVEIEQAFERPVSMDTTGAEVAPTDVDWRKIIGLIEGQSARTKDIWLAVYLCRAGALASDLDRTLAGAEYLAGLCERFWETMHPTLEEYGFQGRKGPCESLAAFAEFLGPLKRMALLEHPRLGRFSGLDFERFRTGGEAEDGYGVFRGVLSETPDEVLVAVGEKLDAIGLAIKRVDAILVANAQGETGANFQPTYAALADLKRAVLSFAANPPAEDAAATAVTAAVGEQAFVGQSLSGAVNSREDVIKALDAIGDYYRRKEPTSPVPVVLKRVREWVNQDFLSVLADIAPGSLDEARRVLSSQREG